MVMTNVDSGIDQLLKEGKAAARRGDKVMARSLLTQVVESAPHNEEAWMWLSGVVSDPQEQQICLENVLVINANNGQARKGLEYLASKTGSAPRVPVEPSPSDRDFTSPLASDPYAYPGSQPASATGVQDAAGTGVATDPFAPQTAPAGYTAPIPKWMQTDQLDTSLTEAGASSGTAAIGSPADPSMGSPWGMNTSSAALAGNQGSTPEQESMENGFSWATVDPGHSAVTGDHGAHDAPEFDEQGALFAGVEPFAPPAGEDAHVHMASQGSAVDHAELPGAGGSLGLGADLDMSGLFDWGPAQEQDEPATHAPMDMPFGKPGSSVAAPEGMVPHSPGSLFAGSASQVDRSGPSLSPEVSPMGPVGDLHLPSPSELPGASEPTGELQPWYLRPSNNSGGLGSQSQLDSRGKQDSSSYSEPQQQAAGKHQAQTIQCPNCKHEASDTALDCPNCRFSFFVNCPHCHELIDTSDAKPNETETCPYCKGSINKMQLGLLGQAATPQYEVIGDQGMPSYPGMHQYSEIAHPRQGVGFAWVVDVMWLLVIIATVWVLTQLPTWLHLTGQY